MYITRHYDLFYHVCKRKLTNKYVLLWSKKHPTNLQQDEFDTIEQVKTRLNHLKKLAEKREARSMIADINGTTYRAACLDMGIKPI